MEVNSADELLKFLISCAFRRCRMLDGFCRLSVSLKSRLPLVQISVSDTGIGSMLEEFQGLKCGNSIILSGQWDGVLSIMTTSNSDKEIHHLKLDLKDVASSRRLVRLPSATKNGAKFSGTEVSLSLYGEIDGIITIIRLYLQKILLLKASKIAIELIDESGGRTKSIFLQKVCRDPAMNAANIDNLKLGLEEYASKHGNRLDEACNYCFSTGMNVKVGTGIACSRENQQNSGQVMEVVVVISNVNLSMTDQSSCSRSYGQRTEVLYFRDFSPCSLPQPSLEALISIDWKKYGLALKSAGDQDGITLLEWENLPPCLHIDIVLHIYHKQVMTLPCAQNNRIDKFLTRKAVKLALTDLKKRNAGALLSDRAVKICSYAPDLAKTISGLIISSHDLNFQRECFSLLGVASPENEKDAIENMIKDKIISVVAKHDDRGSWGTKEAPAPAPALFQEVEVHGPYEEYEGEVEYLETY